jgi:hypothetical protein
MDDSLSEVAAFFALEEFPNSDDRENFSLPLVSFMTSDDWFRFLDFELTLALELDFELRIPNDLDWGVNE